MESLDHQKKNKLKIVKLKNASHSCKVQDTS